GRYQSDVGRGLECQSMMAPGVRVPGEQEDDQEAHCVKIHALLESSCSRECALPNASPAVARCAGDSSPSAAAVEVAHSRSRAFSVEKRDCVQPPTCEDR